MLIEAHLSARPLPTDDSRSGGQVRTSRRRVALDEGTKTDVSLAILLEEMVKKAVDKASLRDAGTWSES